MRTNFSKTESGFELVEVILAAGILSLTLASIIAVAGRSVVVSRRALESYTASTLLEEGAEAARTVRDGGWTNISGLVSGTTYYPAYDVPTETWSLSTTPSTVISRHLSTRTIVVSDVGRDAGGDIAPAGVDDPGTKFFTETVSWKESDGSAQSKALSFYLSGHHVKDMRRFQKNVFL